MKRRLFVAGVTLLLFLSSFGALFFFNGDVSYAAANLVTNPGFEAGNLSGWTCDSGDAVISSPVHSGSHALQINPGSATTGQCTQTISVQASTAYSLSAWVNGPYAYIGITGGASTWTSSSSYSQLTVNFTSTSTSVTIYIHGWYAQGSVSVDDVVLSGPGGTSTPTPGTTPTTGTTATPTPTKTATPTPTSTPCTNCGGSLPKHVLTGYWQNFNNGAKVLKLADVNTNYDLIAIAFADTDPSKAGAVVFNLDAGLSSALGGYTVAQFKADVATVHGRGKKVIISVGGQNGTVSISDANSATNFANSVYSIMTTYGIDGVDIDLENGVSSTYMGSALRQLSAKAGSGLIITFAPQTIDMQSTGMEYFKLALNIKDILTIVNTQYYNSGSMNGCNGNVYSQSTVDFLTALSCIQLQGGLRPDQVGLGLPASTSGAGSGYQSPGNVNNAMSCLASGTSCGSFHPTSSWSIRGAMTWSINWDASNGWNFANTVKPFLNTLP